LGVEIPHGNPADTKLYQSMIDKVITDYGIVPKNLKRGFGIRRCNWKGWEHFVQKVYWSVIGYNIRVMTSHVLAALLKRGGAAAAATAA
jgi:hypothetical protein